MRDLGVLFASWGMNPIGPPDFNGDGDVGPFDLASLLAAWGPCPAEGDCPADLNADGIVDPFDLVTLLAAWGECP